MHKCSEESKANEKQEPAESTDKKGEGQKFGQWRTIAVPIIKDGRRYVLCKCNCGNERYVSLSILKAGKSLRCRSCAIRKSNKERPKNPNAVTKDKRFWVWAAMHARCSNPNNKSFKNYGGRGISVCDNWKYFAVFIKDMGERPEGTTLERINNDGNYCKDNCIWATHRIQANNTRHCVYLEFNGITKTIAEWSRGLGLKPNTVGQRLREYGWSLEDALTIPKGQRRIKACP